MFTTIYKCQSHIVRKLSLGFQTRSEINQLVQSKKNARSLRFLI